MNKGCLFTYGDGIAGRTYYVRMPCGTTLESQTSAGDDELAKMSAAEKLKEYGYDYEPSEIQFKWDGSM